MQRQPSLHRVDSKGVYAMVSIPGSRAQPTAATGGGRASRPLPWELRLSRFQFLTVTFFAFGTVMTSYYLGFVSGKAVGVEAALDGAVASLPKLPIVPPLDEGTEEPMVGGEAVERLDVERAAQPVAEVPLKKDSEGLQAIPEVQASSTGLPRPQDALEKVLEDRAVVVKTTATAAAPTVAAQKAADGEAGSKLGLQLLRQGTVPRGWYVQVAAPTTVEQARAAAAALVEAGFPVVIEDVKMSKKQEKQYYRVLVGPEADKLPGERMVSQVKETGLVTGDPFLRRVK